MIVQVALLPEGKITLVADKRLVLGVDKLVPRELGLDPKLPRAYVARVILLAGVRGHVGHHLLPPAEPFAAVRTRVREHVGVQLSVDVQGRLRLERLPARVTDVRPFASVGTPVILPGSLRRERLAAQVAHKVLQLRVYVPEVSGQPAGVAELFAAHVTGERPLVLVNPHVAQIRVLQLEKPPALGALERLLHVRRASKNLAQILIVLFVVEYQMRRLVVVVRDLVSLAFLLLACDRSKLVTVLVAVGIFYRALRRDILFLHFDGQLTVTLQLLRYIGRLIVRRVHDGDPDRVGVLGRHARLCQAAYSRLASFPVWLPKCFRRVRGHSKRCPDAARPAK